MIGRERDCKFFFRFFSMGQKGVSLDIQTDTEKGGRKVASAAAGPLLSPLSSLHQDSAQL